MSMSQWTARDEAVQRLFDALVLLGRSLKARGADWNLVDPDLSRSEVHALGVIATVGPCRPGHVAEKLCVDRSVVSRLLATLDHLGLVERTADPADGRAELVSVTEAGNRRLLAARDALCSALGERLEPWDPGGIDEVTHLLTDLTNRLQNPLIPASKKDLHV